MSRTLRFAAAVLVVSTLACGSLQALPLATRALPADGDRGAVLVAIAEWIAAFFAPEGPRETAPTQPQPKEGSQLDPDGG